jgi:hypothetical protein
MVNKAALQPQHLPWQVPPYQQLLQQHSPWRWEGGSSGLGLNNYSLYEELGYGRSYLRFFQYTELLLSGGSQ